MRVHHSLSINHEINLCTGEIVGGADRLDPAIFDKAGDSLITNFGKEEWRSVSIAL
jgi:hypothetical protein